MSACSWTTPQRAAEGTHTSVDGEHGRIETRTAMVSSDISWLREHHAWPGLAAVGKVLRIRESGDKITTEAAYYLLSTPLSAERFSQVARQHWGVENSLHWVLDVTMNEDQSRNRKDHGPENLAMLRRLALNLGNRSLRPLTGGSGLIVHLESRPHKGAGNMFCHALSSLVWRFSTRILGPI